MILRLSLGLPEDTTYIRTTRLLRRCLLQDIRVNRDTINDVELIVTELCSNVIRQYSLLHSARSQQHPGPRHLLFVSELFACSWRHCTRQRYTLGRAACNTALGSQRTTSKNNQPMQVQPAMPSSARQGDMAPGAAGTVPSLEGRHGPPASVAGRAEGPSAPERRCAKPNSQAFTASKLVASR